MEQKIFQLKLTTQATSLYLLLAAFSEQDLRLERRLALDYWNASEPELDQAFLELKQRGVMTENGNEWLISPAASWG